MPDTQITGYIVIHDYPFANGAIGRQAVSSVYEPTDAGYGAAENQLAYCEGMQERDRPGSKGRYYIAEVRKVDDLAAAERKFINGLPLEDKVNHQHTRFAEHVADAVVNNREFPWRELDGIKADSRDVAVEAISAAFMELWRHDVIDPDALVAFLDKEVSNG